MIAGGIRATDHWHVLTNDGTCSRCRREVPDGEVPLLLWRGSDLLIYCERCLHGLPPLPLVTGEGWHFVCPWFGAECLAACQARGDFSAQPETCERDAQIEAGIRLCEQRANRTHNSGTDS
jgi:hypothetical protein